MDTCDAGGVLRVRELLHKNVIRGQIGYSLGDKRDNCDLGGF